MSRIGNQPIPLPQGVKVNIQGNRVEVQGPLGTLTRTFHSDMTIIQEDGQLKVRRPSDARLLRALHGLTRTLLANMVTGVHQGYRRSLDLVGVGYRVQQTGEGITLQVGFSHNVEISPMPGVKLTVEGNNRIHVEGTDKEVVGEMAARIRAVKPPDPYKGKGVRYSGEQVRLKPGKSAKRA